MWQYQLKFSERTNLNIWLGFDPLSWHVSITDPHKKNYWNISKICKNQVTLFMEIFVILYWAPFLVFGPSYHYKLGRIQSSSLTKLQSRKKKKKTETISGKPFLFLQLMQNGLHWSCTHPSHEQPVSPECCGNSVKDFTEV